MVIDRNSLEQSEEFLVLTKRSIKVNLARNYEYTDFDFQELLYKNGYYMTYYELAYSVYDELTRILTNLIVDNSILDLEIIKRHMKNATNYLLLFLKNVKILTFFKNDKFVLTNKPLKETNEDISKLINLSILEIIQAYNIYLDYLLQKGKEELTIESIKLTSGTLFFTNNFNKLKLLEISLSMESIKYFKDKENKYTEDLKWKKQFYWTTGISIIMAFLTIIAIIISALVGSKII
ncbi:hypothetical protein [Spiroplasma sp. DGKH1]|uniref:hypothetical protein n=1 Tax=Spiroplasma sp. DGKH1 TaxID=3050074 RepID=UPI0034C61E8E